MNITTLDASQLQALFGNKVQIAVRAFQSLFAFAQQTVTGAVIGANSQAVPINPGDLSFTALSDTQLKLQYMGSDNVIRSVTLTLT